MNPDGVHYVPDHVAVQDQPTCYFSFATSTITSTASYSESLSVDASVEGEGWGASFSASAGYTSAKDTTSSYETRLYSAKAECAAYKAWIDYKYANLTTDFKEHVHDLGTNSSDKMQLVKYRAFIEYIGTHFVSSMTMGGRYGFESELSVSKVVELSSQGINVKVAAGYSGLASVSASAATDYQKKQAKEFDESRSSVKEFFVGGGPPSDNENWTAHAWSTTVKENPLPVSYMLISIESLFTHEYFPEDKDISVKRKMLKNAMREYCLSTSSEPELCDNEFRNSTSLIPLRMTSDLTGYIYDDSYSYFLWMPTLKPFERVPGVIVTSIQEKPKYAFTIKTTQPSSDLSDVVRPAKSWKSYSAYIVHTVNWPICDDGFSPISDFNENHESSLPCFADKCLIDCKLNQETDSKQNANGVATRFLYIYVHENGYPDLGGNWGKMGSSFVKYIIGGDDMPFSQPGKCLSYECVDF